MEDDPPQIDCKELDTFMAKLANGPIVKRAYGSQLLVKPVTYVRQYRENLHMRNSTATGHGQPVIRQQRLIDDDTMTTYLVNEFCCCRRPAERWWRRRM